MGLLTKSDFTLTNGNGVQAQDEIARFQIPRGFAYEFPPQPIEIALTKQFSFLATACVSSFSCTDPLPLIAPPNWQLTQQVEINTSGTNLAPSSINHASNLVYHVGQAASTSMYVNHIFGGHGILKIRVYTPDANLYYDLYDGAVQRFHVSDPYKGTSCPRILNTIIIPEKFWIKLMLKDPNESTALDWDNTGSGTDSFIPQVNMYYIRHSMGELYGRDPKFVEHLKVRMLGRK